MLGKVGLRRCRGLRLRVAIGILLAMAAGVGTATMGRANQGGSGNTGSTSSSCPPTCTRPTLFVDPSHGVALASFRAMYVYTQWNSYCSMETVQFFWDDSGGTSLGYAPMTSNCQATLDGITAPEREANPGTHKVIAQIATFGGWKPATAQYLIDPDPAYSLEASPSHGPAGSTLYLKYSIANVTNCKHNHVAFFWDGAAAGDGTLLGAADLTPGCTAVWGGNIPGSAISGPHTVWGMVTSGSPGGSTSASDAVTVDESNQSTPTPTPEPTPTPTAHPGDQGHSTSSGPPAGGTPGPTGSGATPVETATPSPEPTIGGGGYAGVNAPPAILDAASVPPSEPLSPISGLAALPMNTSWLWICLVLINVAAVASIVRTSLLRWRRPVEE